MDLMYDYDRMGWIQNTGCRWSDRWIFSPGTGTFEGDVITKIGGRSVHIWNDISLYNLTHSEEKEVEITYKRDGKTHTAVMEPRQKEGDTAPLLGVTGGKMERPGFFEP